MADAPSDAARKPCKRCNGADAPHTLRNAPTCRNCFVDYVEGKAGRRLGALARETRTSARPAPRRYLAGLSFGPSSTVLARVLDDSARFHSSRRSAAAFEPLVVHVDTDLSRPDAADSPARRRLAAYRQRFANLSFECVHVSRVLDASTVDWAAVVAAAGVVPDGGADGRDRVGRLRRLFDALPSAASRAHLMRLLVRSLLLDMALERASSALLLGHSTTALAALTLSEVAGGRGHVVPWLVNDGAYAVPTYAPSSAAAAPARAEMPVYYPLREVLGCEIAAYLDMVPSLRELVPPAAGAAPASVVSHRDASLDDVVARFFDGVEGPYAGIVANVVRTAGKLDRASAPASCPLCGMPLDERGDSRWAGELGDDPDGGGGWKRLCYDCRRTMRG